MQKYSINHIKLLLAKLYPSFYDAIKNDFTEQAFEDVKIVPEVGMVLKVYSDTENDYTFNIEFIKNETCIINIISTNKSVKYNIKTVSEYLADGTWQIVSMPEKHKGALHLHDEISIIEYKSSILNDGVTIHFKYENKDYVCNKTKNIDKDIMIISDGKGVIIYSTTYPEKNTATGNYLETLMFKITKS